MSKSKLLFDLIMYINAKRSFTAQEVAYELGVSVRTAHRYLLELGEMGVPIYTEQGRHGGYRVLDARTLPPVLFDEQEAFAIFFAFQSLAYYESLPFQLNVQTAAHKLAANLPEDTKAKIDRLAKVLLFWHRKRSVPSPYLMDILDAALEDKVVRMTYDSGTGDKEKEVKPIGVYAYDGLWYMPALDIKKRSVRQYRVDRIRAVAVTGQTQHVSVSLREWLDGQERNEATEPIRLYVRLTRQGIRHCRSEPWLEPHLTLSGEDEGIIDTEIDVSETAYVSDYFFRLGTDAKVVEPAAIIENIRQRAEEVMRHYQTNGDMGTI
ncbi:helix-turn-helix transcriptional regulator [Paenibacillus sp. 1P07SE]|uniref:helix-turn-helix transcriptional regulator n=1 Tax=Paenibacillus sp. 1P07SE TaxID=3132209 RepID=UPI0039A6FFA9